VATGLGVSLAVSTLTCRVATEAGSPCPIRRLTNTRAHGPGPGPARAPGPTAAGRSCARPLLPCFHPSARCAPLACTALRLGTS
jgi:hypothetical protein